MQLIAARNCRCKIQATAWIVSKLIVIRIMILEKSSTSISSWSRKLKPCTHTSQSVPAAHATHSLCDGRASSRIHLMHSVQIGLLRFSLHLHAWSKALCVSSDDDLTESSWNLSLFFHSTLKSSAAYLICSNSYSKTGPCLPLRSCAVAVSMCNVPFCA